MVGDGALDLLRCDLAGKPAPTQLRQCVSAHAAVPQR